MSADVGWSYQDAVRHAEELLKKSGLPLPKRPAGLAEEYEWPNDVTALTSTQLGQLMGRLSGWQGYSTRLLGMAAIDLHAFETIYDLLLGRAMGKLSSEKRQVKEVLKAVSVDSDPILTKLTRALVTKKAAVEALQMQVEIYKQHWLALSREQARRADEIKERSLVGG